MFTSSGMLSYIFLFMKFILPFVIPFFISDNPISLQRVEFGAYCDAFTIVHYTLPLFSVSISHLFFLRQLN